VDTITSFLQMGGYAAYVWPSFAVTVVVLAGLFAQSLKFLRAGEQALEELQAEEDASDEA
jgi:heme exporter protein D